MYVPGIHSKKIELQQKKKLNFKDDRFPKA